MDEKTKLDVLFVSAECIPFCANGGVADMCYALPKYLNKSFFINICNNLIAKTPPTAEVITPTINGNTGTIISVSIASLNSTRPLARTAGMQRIKEYLIIFFFDTPQQRPAEIVEPEREMPGKQAANNWAIPIINAVTGVIFFFVL
mgnify:CR=1 FL=1